MDVKDDPPDVIRLRHILAKHGFGHAALNIDLREIRNVSVAIRAWENYPKSMNAYPKGRRREITK